MADPISTGLAAAGSAGARASQTALTGALEKDPEMLLNAYTEHLKKLGYSNEEIAARVNSFQATMRAVERMNEEFTNLGLDVTKYRQTLYQSILDSHVRMTTEQAAKSSDALTRLMDDMNRQFLESEKLKLASKIAPYETAGRFAGFVYAIGAVIEAVSPGSGTTLMAQSQNMITQINNQISNVKLATPNSQQLLAAYQGVQQYVQGININDNALLVRHGRHLGDTVADNGAGAPESTGALRNRASDASRGDTRSQLPAAGLTPRNGNGYDTDGSGSGAIPSGATPSPQRRTGGNGYDAPQTGSSTPPVGGKQSEAAPAVEPLHRKTAAYQSLDEAGRAKVDAVVVPDQYAPKAVSFKRSDIAAAQDIGAVLAGITGKGALTSKQIYGISDTIAGIDTAKDGINTPEEYVSLEARLLADKTISEAQRKAVLSSPLVKEGAMPAPALEPQ